MCVYMYIFIYINIYILCVQREFSQLFTVYIQNFTNLFFLLLGFSFFWNFFKFFFVLFFCILFEIYFLTLFFSIPSFAFLFLSLIYHPLLFLLSF